MTVTIDTTVFTPVTFTGEGSWSDHDSFTMGSYRGVMPRFYESDPVFAYEVPCTSWGEYCGDDVQRSNYRSLLRDYPDVFKSVDGGMGSHYLIIRRQDLFHREDIREMLTELARDYPLYDEEDHSLLIAELAGEAWDAYLAHDVARDLEVLLHADDISEVIERYGENILRTEFYQLTYSQPYGPEAESATSVTFPFYDVTVAELARRVGASNPIR